MNKNILVKEKLLELEAKERKIKFLEEEKAKIIKDIEGLDGDLALRPHIRYREGDFIVWQILSKIINNEPCNCKYKASIFYDNYDRLHCSCCGGLL